MLRRATCRLTRWLLDPYDENRTTGSFILIQSGDQRDRRGWHDQLRAAAQSNVNWQELDVDKKLREYGINVLELRLRVRPAGKSTIMRTSSRRSFSMGATTIPDGDNIEHNLNGTLASPMPTGSRISAASAKFPSFPRSRHDHDRLFHLALQPNADMTRRLFDEGEFIEVFVGAP